MISQRLARLAAAATAGAAGLCLTVGASAASGATVTSGDFTTLAIGVTRGYDISGHAHMVRTAAGSTVVAIHAQGLHPDTAYLSHVHQAPCSDNMGGGHYRFDPTGPAAPPNEIWLNFVSDDAGVGNQNATVDAVAGPTARSVVIHDADGKRIACADLG